MKSKLLTKFIPLVSAFAVQAPAFSEIVETGSSPWHTRSLDPEATAVEIIDLLSKSDYFNVYDYVSKKVVNHYKSAMIQYKPEQMGIDFDLYGVAISEYGIRYGNLAYFDQALASISRSNDGWGKCFVEEIFRKTASRTDGNLCEVDLRSERGTFVKLALLKESDEWRLNGIVVDDFYWPIGMEAQSQPNDADNPKTSPENPKNQPDD